MGDDVAAVPRGKGKLILKVDMLVEHTDVPPGMTYRLAARKSVAMCVSDFAAKGVRPDSFMVSLGLKRGATQAQVYELSSGFRDAVREWGVHMVGGDTNEASELVIDCAMAGFAEGLVSRRGARAGDILVTSGAFGYPPAGLKILGGKAKAAAGFAAKARTSVLKPTPNLRVGLALAPFLTSAMDSSDGLSRSVHTLARESGVGFEVRNLPVGIGVPEFARANNLDVEKLVLDGGEEYLIVGTVRKSRIAEARAAALRAGGTLMDIGVATPDRDIVVLRRGKGVTPIEDSGWTHLRRG